MNSWFIPNTFKRVPFGNHPIDKTLSVFVEKFRNQDTILAIVKRMEKELKNVLRGQVSPLTKKQTYIQDFPDGKEHGDFLGVHFDYGVINFAGIKVKGLQTLETVHETVVVPEEERLLRGTERVLFVTKALKQFSRRVRPSEFPDIGETWNLGFNCGYLKEEVKFGLKRIRAGSWPDEYNFTGKPVRMKNLYKEINRAADKIGFRLAIKGFIQTPESVFLHGIWNYSSITASLSLDDRCAICFKAITNQVRKVSNKDEDKPHILLNIYWDNFGDDGSLHQILNIFDEIVQKDKTNTFKRIVSEPYLIQLVREVVLQLAENGLVFNNNKSNTKQLLGYIQEDKHAISVMSRSYFRGMSDQLSRTFRLDSLSVEETFTISRVVDIVSWRASFLLGMLIYACLNQSDVLSDETVFLINGAHVKNEIAYISEAVQYIFELYGQKSRKKMKVKFSTESKVFGAAILAAIYTKDPFDYDEDFAEII